MFDEDEKKLLRLLVEREMKELDEDEGEIRPKVPQLLAIEENYGEFLKKVLDKLR